MTFIYTVFINITYLSYMNEWLIIPEITSCKINGNSQDKSLPPPLGIRRTRLQVTIIDMPSAASPYFCPRHFESLLVATRDDTKKYRLMI